VTDNLSISIAKSKQDFKDIFEVRRKVFVEEQNVTEDEEYDEFENSSTHLIARVDNKCVGTMRYRKTDHGTKLERFAVLKKYRKSGVGRSLLLEALNQISNQETIYLHAQIQVVDFYRKYGFIADDMVFVEANIKHKKMVYKQI
jgi:predicted GNAT family N-acyltransferase